VRFLRAAPQGIRGGRHSRSGAAVKGATYEDQ
jgi:hypothetical protein